MASQAKVIISGQNQLTPAIKSATNDLNGFESTAKKVGSTLKSAFVITAIIASLKELGSAAKQCFNEFTTAERSYKQLALALRDTSAYDQAIKTIDTLSRQTLASKGDIESMVAELAALGKSGEEIEKISTAAVALSNVTGKDLKSSMTTLLNTYNGTTTALNRLGIKTNQFTKEEIEQGAAIQEVIDTLGDYSKAMAEADSSQHLQNIKNTWGDIRQVIGGVIDYSFKDLFKRFDDGLANSYGNITNVIQYIGAVINNLPKVASLALNSIWSMVKKTFEWDSIKTIFISAAENIFTIATTTLKLIFTSIPKMVWNLVKGIGIYIAYIGVNIKNTILQAIEDLLNYLPSHLPDWAKRLFGLDSSGNVFKFNVDKKSADNLKKLANEAFESAGSAAVDSIKDFLEARTAVKDNISETLTSLYGDIFNDFKQGVDSVIQPTLAEIKEYSEASNQGSLLNGLGGLGGNDGGANGSSLNIFGNTVAKTNEIIKKYSNILDYGLTDLQKELKIRKTIAAELGKEALTVYERLTLVAMLLKEDQKILDLKNKEAKAYQDNIDAVDNWRKSLKEANEKALHPLRASIDSLFGKDGRYSKGYWSTETYTDNNGVEHQQNVYNAGGSEQALWGELASVVSNLLGEFSTFVDAIISGNVWLAAVIEVIRGFAEGFKPFLSQILNPILDALRQFGAALAEASIIKELVNIVNTFLPILKTIMNIITPIVSIISSISSILMEVLMPIFKGLAYVLITITGTFEWVIAWFKYWIDSFCNWLASINILGWRPFAGLERKATKPTSYAEFMSDKYSVIDAGHDTSYDAAASTSVTNASYSGSTSVTINIYQQAPVVGSNGMFEFCQMIKDTFDEMSYYGVSA